MARTKLTKELHDLVLKDLIKSKGKESNVDLAKKYKTNMYAISRIRQGKTRFSDGKVPKIQTKTGRKSKFVKTEEGRENKYKELLKMIVNKEKISANTYKKIAEALLD